MSFLDGVTNNIREHVIGKQIYTDLEIGNNSENVPSVMKSRSIDYGFQLTENCKSVIWKGQAVCKNFQHTDTYRRHSLH
jgi:hypothetical protein